MSPVSLKLFGCTTAPVACTGGLIQKSSATSTTILVSTTNTSDNGVAKIDYNPSNQHRINGLVVIGNYLGTALTTRW